MLTFETFKNSLGLKEIKTKKSKTGKIFLDVPGISAYISDKCDLRKALYITECKAKTGETVLVVCNQGWTDSTLVL